VTNHEILTLDPPNPLNKGASELKVPLTKGDLGGSPRFKYLVQTFQYSQVSGISKSAGHFCGAVQKSP
jgi:hypothetical protein